MPEEQNQIQEETPPSSSPEAPVAEPKPSSDEGFWRRKAEKSEKRLQELERASMSELDRAKAERDEWKARHEATESQLREHNMRSAFVSKAAAAGVHDPDAAFQLTDRSKLALSEDGKLVGADSALLQLKRERPYLFAGGGQLGSGGGKGKSDSTVSTKDRMNDEIRRKAFGG